MRLLLDTHALLWHYLDAPQLSASAKAEIADPANQVLVSPVNYWELAIKIAAGKYLLQVPFSTFIQEAIADNGFAVLPIEPRHAERLVGLPFHHKDPFDRLLVAQALVEDMPLVSADPVLGAYGVRRVW